MTRPTYFQIAGIFVLFATMLVSLPEAFCDERDGSRRWRQQQRRALKEARERQEDYRERQEEYRERQQEALEDYYEELEDYYEELEERREKMRERAEKARRRGVIIPGQPIPQYSPFGQQPGVIIDAPHVQHHPPAALPGEARPFIPNHIQGLIDGILSGVQQAHPPATHGTVIQSTTPPPAQFPVPQNRGDLIPSPPPPGIEFASPQMATGQHPRVALNSAASQLHRQLSRLSTGEHWKRYLKVGELLKLSSSSSTMTTENREQLKKLVERMETIAGNRQYEMIVELAGYTESLEAARALLQLAEQPQEIPPAVAETSRDDPQVGGKIAIEPEDRVADAVAPVTASPVPTVAPEFADEVPQDTPAQVEEIPAPTSY